MMSKSKIPWTEYTWNPIVGCTKISPGCQNCYAESMAKRLAAMGQWEYDQVIGKDGKWNGRILAKNTPMRLPLRPKKTARVFICSMGDLFHEKVKYGWQRNLMCRLMARPQYEFVMLTKRAERMRDFFARYYGESGGCTKNLTLGITAENNEQLFERMPYLSNTAAYCRIVSMEPLLSRMKFSMGGSSIDGVIVGCESGPKKKRRPMKLDWVRDIRDQCEAAGVAFFFKQAEIDGKVVKMPELDGVVHDAWAGVKP